MKKSCKAVIIVLVFIFSSIYSFAAETVGGTAACLSETDYEDLITMIDRKDLTGFSFMLKSNKCLILKDGLKASVLDWSFSRARLRVYNGDVSAIVWTSSGAVRDI